MERQKMQSELSLGRKCLSILLAALLAFSISPGLAYADGVEQQPDPVAANVGETSPDNDLSNAGSGDGLSGENVGDSGATDENEINSDVNDGNSDAVDTSESDESSFSQQVESSQGEVADSSEKEPASIVPSSSELDGAGIDSAEASEAEEQFSEEFQWQGTDFLTHSEFGMITISSATEEIPSSDEAEIKVELKDSAELKEALSGSYEGDTSFAKMYDFSVVSKTDGSEIVMPEDAVYTISYVSMETQGVVPAVFAFSAGELTRVDAEELPSYTMPGLMFGITASVPSLKGVAFVDVSTLEEKPDEPEAQPYSKTFQGVGTLFTVTISGETSDAAFVESLEASSLSARVLTPQTGAEDAGYENARELLAEKFDGDPAHYYAKFSLTANGEELALPADVNVKIEFDRASFAPYSDFGGNPLYYNIVDGQLSELTVESTTDIVPGMMWRDALSPSNVLGEVVIANGANLTEKGSGITDLAPGSYTVDANLYVPADQAPIGANAYMTTTDFPPLAAEKQNGELLVGEDGSVTVTVYPVQEIFTLQSIGDGENVHIQSIERGGYAESYGPHPDRITKIVATLDDDSGLYLFSDCVQYPTILQTDKNWDVYLEVDFSSATEGAYNPDAGEEYSKTFVDEATGVSATVSTTEQDLGAQLETLSFEASAMSEGDEYESAKKLLSSEYASEPPFVLYELLLKDATGNRVELGGNTNVMVSLPNDGMESAYIDVWKYSKDSVEELEAISQDGKLLIRDSDLHSYAVVDASSTNQFIKGSFSDDATGISGELAISDESLSAASMTNPEFTSYSFGKSETAQGMAYTMSMIYDVSSVSVTFDQEVADLANQYMASGMGAEEAKQKALEEVSARYHVPPDFWFHPGEAYLHLSIPVQSDSDRVVLVRDNGSTRYAETIAAQVSNGYAEFDLLASMPRSYGKTLLNDMHNAFINGIDSGSADAPVAYLLVVSSDQAIAGYPYNMAELSDNQRFTYNGEMQEGVKLGDNTKIVEGEASAKNAGSYEVLIEPEEGYTWIDGTTDPVSVTWEIGKASLWVQLANPSIAYDAVPSYELTARGFVNGETAETIEGFTFPTIREESKPDVVEPGESYAIRADYSHAYPGANYVFEGSGENADLGQLVIGMAPDQEPSVASSLVYNGKEQTGVVLNSDAYYLSGASWSVSSAVNAGEYTASFYLTSSNSAWSDGSTGTKTITWSIAPAELTATYVGEEIPSTSKPELKVEVEGFVNGETAETADGYEAPYVTAPDVIEEGETYELTPEGGKATNYTFTYKSGQLRVAAPEYLEPGTYSITANLRMPGEYNPVIAGLDVYANSPDNPFGPVIDENDPAEVGDSVPNTPESMNATLVVGEDGTKTLVLPIKNPVFTTQDLGTCAELKNVKTERVYPANPEAWDYGSYDTRIHKMSAELTDSLTEGTISYLFTGSVLYAVPLDLELKPSGSVALELEIDYSSMEKVSDSTQVPVLDEAIGEDDPSDPDPDPSDPSNPGGNQGGSGGQGSGSGSGNQGGITGGNGTQVGPGTAGTVDSGTLKAGTYTVSANIWFDKADTGLPLNPHITSSVFPPMNPVSNNATLTVDSSGRARVSVPITIQDKVMSVKSISGLNIVNSSSSGGKLTSITVDLGVIDASTSVITESCSVGIHIGDIAATIMPESVLQGTREHTWPATFQVNFSGVPASGGGTVPASVQALLNGSTDGSALESATADEAAADAQAAGEAAAALASRNANAGSGSGVGAAVRNLEDAMERNPWLGFALGAGTVLVLGAIGVGLYAWRRRVAQAAADGSAAQTPTV